MGPGHLSPVRGIGARLGMSLASVQLAVRRIQARGVPEEPNLPEMYRALRGKKRTDAAMADDSGTVDADDWSVIEAEEGAALASVMACR